MSVATSVLTLAETPLLEAPLSLSVPNMLFSKTDCYWPSVIGLREKFTPKWVIFNQSNVNGNVWLGVTYKGKNYLGRIEGYNSHVPLEARQGVVFSIKDATIELLFKDLETFEKSKTLEITFVTGFFADNKYYITDNWPVTTYVEVSGKTPAWLLWVGAGTLACVGLILLVRKK